MPNKKFVDVPEGYKLIFRIYVTLPDGRRIYARQRGIKAFPLIVKDEK